MQFVRRTIDCAIEFRAGQTRIIEEGRHRMSRGGCCLRYINFRFVIVPRDSRDSLRFARQRGGHAPGYLFYIINARFKQRSCVLLQISLESRSNRVKYYGFRSVIPFNDLKLPSFPLEGKMHRAALHSLRIDSKNCNRSRIAIADSKIVYLDQKTKSLFFRSMKILLYFVAEEIYQKLCSFIDEERYICERGGLI